MGQGVPPYRLETRVITLGARPEPVQVALDRSAVLVVDMQNDFGARGGMFDRAGIDIAPIERVVEPTARVLDAARGAGVLVVYLVMQFSPDLSDAGGPDLPNRIKHRPLALGEAMAAPDGRAGRILVEGTWNAEILPRLAPRHGDLLVPKHRYSGFFETNLDSILRARGIRHLIVTGCTTSVCVESRCGTRCSGTIFHGAGGLHRRAHRGKPAAEQPRRVAFEHRAAFRLGVRLRAVH